jgi:prepilin-type N-terminal cleavage/methylation domain-containing protein/prepilin-type processing-associated H-X9-DG protein
LKHRAFTLVELIVVVAIIAILAALILAGVQNVRRRAGATHSASNIRTLALANIAYQAENGRYCPADDRRNNRRWHGARKAGGKFDPAEGFLAPYLGKERRVTPCPVFQHMLKGSGTFEEGTGGYGYNAAYIGGTPAWKWNGDGTRESAVAAAVERPARTVMFTSTAYARAEGLQEYPYCEPPFWDFGDGPSGSRPSPTVHFRFDGKAVVAWCDGHVTFEVREPRDEGDNPHGGDARGNDLGWFGPDEENGFWNPHAEIHPGKATAR